MTKKKKVCISPEQIKTQSNNKINKTNKTPVQSIVMTSV